MNEGFKITRKPVPMPPKKSAAAEMVESFFYVIIILGIYYVLVGIWKIITAPFVALFTSDRTKLLRKIKIAVEKKSARDKRFFLYRDFEFDEKKCRVMLPVESNGLDTDLILVPNMYYPTPYLPSYKKYFTDQEEYIAEEFLDYLKEQVELHMTVSFVLRHKFLQTIRNYYPEFTPKFNVILSEIEELRETAKSVDLANQLIEEMVKAGLGEFQALKIIMDCGDDGEKFRKEYFKAKREAVCTNSF